LPGTVVSPVTLALAELLAILKVVGYQSHDLVVSDPLILLADALCLRRVPTVISDREAVKVTEALGGPTQVKNPPEDIPLYKS
jgi:hypothetical protein